MRRHDWEPREHSAPKRTLLRAPEQFKSSSNPWDKKKVPAPGQIEGWNRKLMVLVQHASTSYAECACWSAVSHVTVECNSSVTLVAAVSCYEKLAIGAGARRAILSPLSSILISPHVLPNLANLLASKIFMMIVPGCASEPLC